MKKSHNSILEPLLSLREDKYKEFNTKLLPTIDPSRVLGIRIPILRKYAQTLLKEPSNHPMVTSFLSSLPHHYIEEEHLHALLLAPIKDFDYAIEQTEHFLPHIDNWQTSDIYSPKSFYSNHDLLTPILQRWLQSSHVYMVRFAIVTLMRHYLTDSFNIDWHHRVSQIPPSDYYIEIAIAWYFATALDKQYEATLPYLTSTLLSQSRQRQSIQKALESFKIPDEVKLRLRQTRQKLNKTSSQ